MDPPVSIGIVGPSRPDLDRLALALARAREPEFAWFHVTASGTPPASRELEVLEEAGLDRVRLVDRVDLRPHDATSALPVFVARPSVPAARTVDGVADRLHLPDPLLEVVEARDLGTGPRTVVLANFDSTLDLVPDPEAYLGFVIEALSDGGVDLIVTMGSTPTEFRARFHSVIQVGASASPNSWNPTIDWSGSRALIGEVLGSVASGPTASEFVRKLGSARSQGDENRPSP